MTSMFKNNSYQTNHVPPFGACSRLLAIQALAIFTVVLSGCALQPAYVKPSIQIPAAWSVESEHASIQTEAASSFWWRELGDVAIDHLVEAAFADNPTLIQAVTRIDEARSTLGVNAAATLPAIGIDASVTRAQVRNTSPASSSTTVKSTSASLGPNFSWEIDLFGRVRQSMEAAQNRLDARTSDAASTRLALAADVANGVLSLRACENTRRVFSEDIKSREKTLTLTRLRLKTGFVAPIDEARAVSGIATSRSNLASQNEQCSRQVNALVALSGKGSHTVKTLIGITDLTDDTVPVFIPKAPTAKLELPAIVLAMHPDVVSSEREVAAAWSEIAVARADRLPRINLAAVLTGQWIRAPGFNDGYTTWSIGPSLTGTLFDGGAGAANVNAADARYRRAVASLQSKLRSTVQDVENALAAQTSAIARGTSTSEGVIAARTTFQASEAQWRAGSISLFELEDSRRLYASARDAEISARRDQALAWIAIVKATGGAITTNLDTTTHE